MFQVLLLIIKGANYETRCYDEGFERNREDYKTA